MEPPLWLRVFAFFGNILFAIFGPADMAELRSVCGFFAGWLLRGFFDTKKPADDRRPNP